MVVLGILLLVVAVVVLAFILLGGLPPGPGTEVSFDVFNLTLETSAVALFGLGALTLLILELAVLAIRSGARRSSRKRAELQRLRRVEQEVQARQAAEAQRNTTVPDSGYSAPPPAPFARRDTAERPALRDDDDAAQRREESTQVVRRPGDDDRSETTDATDTPGGAGRGDGDGTATLSPQDRSGDDAGRERHAGERADGAQGDDLPVADRPDGTLSTDAESSRRQA
ncbi:hypothetical protein [Aquipuribacter nitratireducens]|uniref:Lipopolysaccharide assembly protein A domain-containing protein n=1 Tax=Aquipuribacter nitratireducens TaxID=650104 RepID=A0ABW0GRK6_9MICO